MNKQSIAIYAGMSLPILICWTAVIYFAVNIPFMDDFDNLLFFANVEDKWQLLFAQHNEHRLFFNRAIAWLMLTLNGQIDFSILIYLANFMLFAITVILIRNFTADNHYGLVFLPIILLVFSLQHWEIMIWAMGGLQNYSVILFALTAIYFFNKWHYRGFILGLLFAVLAVYTSANGLLIFFIFMLWLIVDFFFKQIPKKLFIIKLSITLIITIIIITSYFYGYISPKGHPSIVLNVQFIHHFLVLLGNYAYIIPLATTIGIITLIVILLLIYRGYYLQNPIYFYFILFLLGSLLMVAAARSGFGLEQAMSSRYKIVSLLLVSCVYLAIAEVFVPVWRKKWVTLSIILALILNISAAVVNLPFLEQRHNLLVNGLKTWQMNNYKEGLGYPNQAHSSMILQMAIKKGVYTLPVFD